MGQPEGLAAQALQVGATLSRRATFDALNLCVAKLPLEDTCQDVKIKLASGESPGGFFCTQVASPFIPSISASVGPGWGLRIYLPVCLIRFLLLAKGPC